MDNCKYIFSRASWLIIFLQGKYLLFLRNTDKIDLIEFIFSQKSKWKFVMLIKYRNIVIFKLMKMYHIKR